MLVVCNWSQFQHYQDRSPPWIKLHRGLMDSVSWHSLQDEAKGMLPMIWLLAAETRDGSLSGDENWLAFRLRADVEKVRRVIVVLLDTGFLEEVDAESLEPKPKWASRHIPDALKTEVWERDSGTCTVCSSIENIEYDHKIPVSRGGRSELGNLQLLCRSCNRRKRAQFAEHFATQAEEAAQPAYSESEGETEKIRGRRARGAGSPKGPLTRATELEGPSLPALTPESEWQKRLDGYQPWLAVRPWSGRWGNPPDSAGSNPIIPRHLLRAWQVKCAAEYGKLP